MAYTTLAKLALSFVVYCNKNYNLYFFNNTRTTHIDQVTLELQLQIIRVVDFPKIYYFWKFPGIFQKIPEILAKAWKL